jgi:hypothetical protein
MKKPFTRLMIYGSFLTVLCLHYLIARRLSEPYPSLIFPSFSGAPKTPNQFQVPVHEIFAVTTTKDTLPVDKDFFRKKVPYVEYEIPVVKTLVKKESISYNNSAVDPDKARFIEYAKEQLKQQYPDKNFESLLIIQERRTYNTDKKITLASVTDHKKTFIQLR